MVGLTETIDQISRALLLETGVRNYMVLMGLAVWFHEHTFSCIDYIGA